MAPADDLPPDDPEAASGPGYRGRARAGPDQGGVSRRQLAHRHPPADPGEAARAGDRPAPAFVARLRRLGLTNSRIIQACLDYYRACIHRDRWAKETLLRFNELADYDDRLRGEWERLWDDLLASLAGADDEAKTRLGREFFQQIDRDAARATVYYIRPRCTEPSISRGSFHKLADEGKLAWHPEDVDALRAATTGGAP